MDDLISRQAVKELAHNQVREKYCGMAFKKQRDFYIKLADSIIDLLPSIQPEIIHCKDCRKHNKKLGFDENYNITYKANACPLIPWRGMSKGHEHDYQSCCFGEKRGVTT